MFRNREYFVGRLRKPAALANTVEIAKAFYLDTLYINGWSINSFGIFLSGMERNGTECDKLLVLK